MKKHLFAAVLLLLGACATAPSGIFPDGESQYEPFAPDGIPFTVAARSWDFDSLGSQRAVVRVPEGKAGDVRVKIPWRRGDLNPGAKGIVVCEAATGRRVEQVVVAGVNPAEGAVSFTAPAAGDYYVYYLPAKFRPGYDEMRFTRWNDYLPAASPSPDTKSRFERSTLVEVVCFESRTRFDFFTPMGLIATPAEEQALLEQTSDDFLIFTEDRAFPIRLAHHLPARWAGRQLDSPGFSGEALRNEYYCFQIGLWAARQEIQDVKLTFSDLKDGSRVIPASAITCFNLEGTGWDGQPLTLSVNVPQGRVQALWCGVDLSAGVKPGTYQGTVTLSARDQAPREIALSIRVLSKNLPDRGDGDLWRHARLRWLNSTIGTDSLPVAPYGAMQLDGRRVTATGKEVLLDGNGLPSSIEINDRSVLSKPLRFVVTTDTGDVVFAAENFSACRPADGLVEWSASSVQEGIAFDCRASMEYDGYLRYTLNVSSEKPVTVKNIRLEANYAPESSAYFMGVGYDGGTRPERWSWDWKPYLWDSFWMGGALSGLHTELLGGAYHGPLHRDYTSDPPASWYNGGAGKVLVEGPRTVVSTGRTSLASEPRRFEFSLLITPQKPVDTRKQFSMRFYHGEPKAAAKELAVSEGANIVNIHHSYDLNPYINYPFVVRDSLKSFIDAEHAQGRKVKLYYTIRELTNHAVELHALRSLGYEILKDGPGHGAPWMTEHLVDEYWPAWYTAFEDQDVDAALVLTGFSRWINYYLEGLRWMFENYGLDGIYMDDVSFDRPVMKRIRKIMETYHPGAIIDLHSNTGYSHGPANQYAGFLPYVDRLWFGEWFHYDEFTPDQWFVQVSGIPFGPMSEMLQGGGNRFLGAVYGMTNRHSWTPVSPAPVWKLWDEFGIADARMVGYWDEAPAVTADQPGVRATAFVKEGETLISVGNFSDRDISARLDIDFQALGLDPARVECVLPEVKDFQAQGLYRPGEPIAIPAKQGKLLILKNK